MPFVVVEFWEGRTEKQKETLMKGIVKAFEEIGVDKEAVTIVLHDTPKCNWWWQGQQASKPKPQSSS